MTSTPKAIIQNEEAGKRTLQRKHPIFKKQIAKSSCSSEAAFNRHVEMLMKTLNRDQRSQVLKSAKISLIEIGAEEMVAIKVDLGIPWKTLKNLAT